MSFHARPDGGAAFRRSRLQKKVAEKRGIESGTVTDRRAELTQAGSYAVHVSMQGHMLPGWPQALHVQPCASKASMCWLSGSALQVRTHCDKKRLSY